MRSARESTASKVVPARLPKGFVLGGCVVDGWLRDGGMAAIYRGRRVSDGRRVALKLQLPSTAHDPAIGARFDLEAEVMCRANGSPHVVELFEAGVLDDGRRYFMLDWVSGENLEELLDSLRNDDLRMPLGRACKIGRDVARGLAELHEHGVLHLDLKPANVMVSAGEGGSDEIKLVDFGIAADLQELSANGGDDAMVMGTSGYMSPEQQQGLPAEASFDVFALGVLMFEALSGGSVPPDGWKPETLPRLETLRRGIPVGLVELVRDCMSFDLGRRPRSVAVVEEALVGIIRGLEAARTGKTQIMPRVQGPAKTGRTLVVRRSEGLHRSGVVAPSPRLPTPVRKRARVRARVRAWVPWVLSGGVVVLLIVVGIWLVREVGQG